MNEDTLIKQIKNGNKTLFEDLIKLYYDDVYRFIYYKTNNPDSSYDLTQETFIKMIRYFNSYSGKGKFKSYLFKIACNICNDYYKKQITEKNNSISSEELFYNQTDTQLNKITVEQILHKLPDFQSETIIYKYILGYKISEIADITNENISTVKSRLKQGLEKMKKYLEKEDYQ